MAKGVNKAEYKTCKTSEMELFLQVVTGFKGELRILQKRSEMELFAKIISN